MLNQTEEIISILNKYYKDGHSPFIGSEIELIKESLFKNLDSMTICEIETESICPHCDNKLRYKVIKEKDYSMDCSFYIRKAYCTSCLKEVTVPEVDKFNKDTMDNLPKNEISIFQDDVPSTTARGEMLAILKESIDKSFFDDIDRKVITLQDDDLALINYKNELSELYDRIVDYPELAGYFVNLPNHIKERFITLNPRTIKYLGEITPTMVRAIFKSLEFSIINKELAICIINAINSSEENKNIAKKVAGDNWTEVVMRCSYE